jgi:uncharacterized protein YfaT (DUF1175 family)
MRAPSKRWPITAGLMVLVLGLLAWSVIRIAFHTANVEGAPAFLRQEAGYREADGSGKRTGSTGSTVGVEGEAQWVDANQNGLPDFAELRSFQDQESFRRWFTSIAETQFYQTSEYWKPEQRDCAGLVRFAMREALRRHDRQWFQRMGPGYQTVAPDVARFDLDHNPLGEKIFRTDFGSLHAGDLRNGKFSEFADGRTLKNFNTVFVSRDRSQARPGDLLFYYQPWVQKFPYHVMIFLGSAKIAPNGAQDWVVYHTGSSPDTQGNVKKVELAVLDRHPDPRWRPVESNRNFLGFYRLKILN